MDDTCDYFLKVYRAMCHIIFVFEFVFPVPVVIIGIKAIIFTYSLGCKSLVANVIYQI